NSSGRRETFGLRCGLYRCCGEIGPLHFERLRGQGRTHRETRMLRRSLAAVVVVLVVGSFVFAETVRGIVTKISDSEVTITVRKDKDDKEGTEKKFKITKDTKFYAIKKGEKEAKESSLGDITKAVETAVEKSKAKGQFATLEVDDGKVTKYTAGFGKKRDK